MKRKILSIAAIVGLVLVTTVGPSSAYDNRSGSRTCSSGYNVGLSTQTTSSETHRHFYESDAGVDRSYVKYNAIGYGTSSFFRVASWRAETPGYFSSAYSSCNQNPN
ncbi:hypothetical protein [Ornithinimicrobium murale]|uniref:hypothetical protein n=1 Tax=Ornithinimicrobium murale TaxID=1050153 RepID=UPI0013B44346|nr:hypothetical protein [Ornithinimicrobium murale]